MSDERQTISVKYAGFWRRSCALLADLLPITLLVASLFYVFLGFDETLRRYLIAGPGDPQARREFLEERNEIRAYAGLAYVVYATFMHALPWRATFGKILFRIRIVDVDLRRIGWKRSFWRTGAMLFSIVPGFLGCLAALWSRTNQSWHDRLAGTYVVTSASIGGSLQADDTRADPD